MMLLSILVFMVVPYTDSWKLPVGYFLVAGLNAEGEREAGKQHLLVPTKIF